VYLNCTQYVCVYVRYLDAVQPVDDGLKLIESGLVPADCFWPGTDTVIPDMSSVQTLKVSGSDRLLMTLQLLVLCVYSTLLHCSLWKCVQCNLIVFTLICWLGLDGSRCLVL